MISLHLLWSILFIFCLLAPEGMNAIVFGRDKGERSEDYCLLGRYIVRRLFSFFNEQKRERACHFTKNKVVTFIYNDKFTMYSDSCDIILSSLTTSRRQYQNKPQPSVPFPISFPKTIEFIHVEPTNRK